MPKNPDTLSATPARTRRAPVAPVAPLPAPAPAPAPAPLSPAPSDASIAVGGEVKFAGEAVSRARRTLRFPIPIPLRVVSAMLRIAAVDAEVAMRERLNLLKVMDAVVPCLLSANQFATAVGVPSSTLSRWASAFSAGGAEALRPKPLGRAAKSQAQHTAFLEVETASVED